MSATEQTMMEEQELANQIVQSKFNGIFNYEPIRKIIFENKKQIITNWNNKHDINYNKWMYAEMKFGFTPRHTRRVKIILAEPDIKTYIDLFADDRITVDERYKIVSAYTTMQEGRFIGMEKFTLHATNELIWIIDERKIFSYLRMIYYCDVLL